MSWTKVECKKPKKDLGSVLKMTIGDWDQMSDLEQDIYTLLDDPINGNVISMTRFAIYDHLKKKYPNDYTRLTETCVIDSLYDDTISKYVQSRGSKPKLWRLKRTGDLIKNKL